MSLAFLSEYLESDQGRSKTLKMLTYLSKLATAFTDSQELNTRLKILSSFLSDCRILPTVLDDIPNIHRAIQYGIGRKEPDWALRVIEVIRNVLDVVGNPLGYVAWAARRNILNLNKEAWDTASDSVYIAYIQLSLVKSLRKLQQIRRCDAYTEKNVAEEQRTELLTCIRLTLDLIYVVNYLPRGILWGSKLNTWQVGALGTISSIIGMYQTITKQAAQNADLNLSKQR